jgi:hypothetical protein
VHEWRRRNTRESREEEESSDINEYKGGGAKGQDVDNLREDEVKMDAIVRFPVLRTES